MTSSRLKGGKRTASYPDYRLSTKPGQYHIVELAGHVRTVAQKQAAEAAAQAVPSVLLVRNHLVDDQTLVVDVAQALAGDPDVRAACLTVACDLGRVTLVGDVPSEDVAARAVALARAVPGVCVVQDAMRRAPQPATSTQAAPAVQTTQLPARRETDDKLGRRLLDEPPPATAGAAGGAPGAAASGEGAPAATVATARGSQGPTHAPRELASA